MTKNKKILRITLITVVSIVVTFLIYILVKSDGPDWSSLNLKEPEITEPILMFDLPIDSFTVETGKIKYGQNLSDLLSSIGISFKDIDYIARNSRPVFDVRKMQVGKNYHFFLKKDSLQSPVYFIYEIDPIEYVVYQLTDSMHIRLGKKPIETRHKTTTGEITSSLWNTMKEQSLNPVLAIELSEIYAWTIDFFGIQKGDKFRIIYDELYVDGESIGIGEIYACQFIHSGESFYAFLFDQNNKESYYDEQGKSLQKAFLKAPLKFSRISSHYSNNRYHPVLKIHRPHHGIDYAAPTGTPVMAIGDGKVVAKGYQANGGGNYIKIKHNSVYTTSYMHLKSFAKGTSKGSFVKQGQVIGYVGQTGLASGPHLDFRVYQNGSPINPLKVKAPPVEPVLKENMERFKHLNDSLMSCLSEISFPEKVVIQSK